MKLMMKILTTAVLVGLMTLSAHATEKVADETTSVTHTVATVNLEATVVSIDRQARTMTVKNKEGETKTINLHDDAGKLDAIDAGDMVSVQYLSTVTLEVVGTDAAQPVATAGAVVAETTPGEKPAAVAAAKVSVVVTIEAIDLKNEMVTLKTEDGKLETVKAKNPENLKKIKVGDQIKITYAEAIGYSITEKPAVK